MRTNVKVGRRTHGGGYEGKIDIAALNPKIGHLRLRVGAVNVKRFSC